MNGSAEVDRNSRRCCAVHGRNGEKEFINFKDEDVEGARRPVGKLHVSPAESKREMK